MIDEAYQPFAVRSWLPRAAEFDNVVVMRTVSKLGLAGIRLGYLVGSPAWLTEFDKVRPPYNINVLTQATADFLLDHLDVLDAQAADLRAERTRLARKWPRCRARRCSRAPAISCWCACRTRPPCSTRCSPSGYWSKRE